MWVTSPCSYKERKLAKRERCKVRFYMFDSAAPSLKKHEYRLKPHEVPRTPSAARARAMAACPHHACLHDASRLRDACPLCSPPSPHRLPAIAHCLPLIALQPSHDLSQPPPLTATMHSTAAPHCRASGRPLCHHAHAQTRRARPALCCMLLLLTPPALCRPNHSINPGPTTAGHQP